jgi:formylglycine-generating enzyme required for sulfatase activity
LRQLRIFGDLTVQVGIILISVAALLSLMRDGFHIYVHDSFAWLITAKQAAFEALLDQPVVSATVELAAAILRRVFALLGVEVNFSPDSHWIYVFILLAVALGGYAHTLRNFKTQPAVSVFRYGNAIICAFVGGLLAGSAPLAHPGMFAWPIASLLAFIGLNAIWWASFGRKPDQRQVAARAALLTICAAILTARIAFELEPEGGVIHPHSSPGLILLALLAAGFGGWFMRFGLGATRADEMGQRLGTQVLAVFGVAAMVIVASQATFWMGRATDGTNVPSAGAVFQDCADCPDMVAIQAGRFLMGTTVEEAELLKSAELWKPARHTQEMPSAERETTSFALARTEVTVAQFKAFMDATGYKPAGWCWGLRDGSLDFSADVTWDAPGFAQEPDHPVVCVNWLDAQAYVRWLSLRTGETYRLPTEAEWEYAARAGSRSVHALSENAQADCLLRNAADVSAKQNFPDWNTFNCDDGAAFTAPVGSYAPNGFGLFDMTGNVWEWVEDCYGPLRTADLDGDTQQLDCSNRVIRGGSWNYGPGEVREATRDVHAPATRGSGLGFRVARELALPSPEIAYSEGAGPGPGAASSP